MGGMVDEVRGAAMAKIESLLGRANARRRERRLGVKDVVGLLSCVAGGEPWAHGHGGEVSASYGRPAVTTLALAARVDGQIYLGIRVVDARSVTPGRAFAELQPWRSRGAVRGPAGEAAAKWAAWARLSAASDDLGVIALDDPEVDAILEARTES